MRDLLIRRQGRVGYLATVTSQTGCSSHYQGCPNNSLPAPLSPPGRRGDFQDSRPAEMGSDRPLWPAPPPPPDRTLDIALYFTDDKTKIKFSDQFFYLTE